MFVCFRIYSYHTLFQISSIITDARLNKPGRILRTEVSYMMAFSVYLYLSKLSYVF